LCFVDVCCQEKKRKRGWGLGSAFYNLYDARPRAMHARSFFLGNVSAIERHEGHVRYERHYAQRKMGGLGGKARGLSARCSRGA